MTENWKTSTRSQSGETCVEVSSDVMVRVRDTKDRERGIIRIGAHPWLAFLSGGWEI